MKTVDYMIHESIESARGCGYRKEGGLYLVSGEMLLHACPKLPHPLVVCGSCGQGYKPFRGFGWVNPREVFAGTPECRLDGCVLSPPPEKAGLIWIGEKFYSAAEFSEEAAVRGVSRRIKSVPKGLVVGETLILLAHREIPSLGDGPGIFGAFIPKAIEYVVKKDDSPETLQRIAERGIRLVRVVRDVDLQMPLFPEEEEIVT